MGPYPPRNWGRARDIASSVENAHSAAQVDVKDRSPKLHYIYPTCFEAGRPMEFVACGSDLLQPKFWFLVSCGGRYMAYNNCVSSLCCKDGESNYFCHQLVKISVPKTDMNLSGPAFIEVENQSGLSNFIPIFVGDKETCEEMEILQQKFDTSVSSPEQPVSPPRPACEVLASRQTQFSGMLNLGTQDKDPAVIAASNENVHCRSSQKDNRLVIPAAKTGVKSKSRRHSRRHRVVITRCRCCNNSSYQRRSCHECQAPCAATKTIRADIFTDISNFTVAYHGHCCCLCLFRSLCQPDCHIYPEVFV